MHSDNLAITKKNHQYHRVQCPPSSIHRYPGRRDPGRRNPGRQNPGRRNPGRRNPIRGNPIQARHEYL